MDEHPGVPPPGACTYDTYPFEQDPRWEQYARNVEIPDGADKEAAMDKVRRKWYDNMIGRHHDEYFAAESAREAAQEGQDPLAGTRCGCGSLALTWVGRRGRRGDEARL